MVSTALDPQPFDKPRDFATFAPYTDLLAIAPEQLDQWLAASKIQPISAIEWDWSERWSVGPRTISDSMWFWFESGHGWGWIGDEKNSFKIKAGDLMLIPQGVRHAIGQDAGVEMHVAAVHFYAQVFGSIDLLELLGFPAHVPSSADSPFEFASNRLAREFAVKAPGWMPLMAAEILEVLLYIIRHHGSRFRSPSGDVSDRELWRLLPALEKINQNLSNPELTVGDVAARVCLSEVQFRKIFRKVTGLSPVKFIQRQRIERACALLRVTDDSVPLIAEQCGFTDVPFFNRIFKHWMRVTPGAYRKDDEF